MTVNPEEPKKTEKPEDEKTKLSETLETLKQNKNVENVMKYAKTHVQDTVAYVLMLVGIIWMFFHEFYGGVLIGLVVGFYFFKEILNVIKSFRDFVSDQGLAKSIILGGTLFAIFIIAPGIVIGTAIMVGLKVMLKQES